MILVVDANLRLSSKEIEFLKLLPRNIRRDPNSCLGLAWDNFDINLETLSGAGSIHHTYGICYQNNTYNSNQIAMSETTVTDNKKRKIKDITKCNDNGPSDDPLTPYFKKPKIDNFKYFRDNIFRPNSYLENVTLDTLWSFSFNTVPNVPMWTGWNTLRCNEVLPKQTIGYHETHHISTNRK